MDIITERTQTMATCSGALSRPLFIDTSDHKHSQAALLATEGIGAQGNYFVRISMQVRSANLYVTARGYSPAMEMPEHQGAFRFYGHARMLEDGRQIVRKRLERESTEVWPDDRYIPVGSAVMCIPEGTTGSLAIEVEVGYEFDSGTGFITPIPPTTKWAKPLRGRRK